jgi:hypothetical protein
MGKKFNKLSEIEIENLIEKYNNRVKLNLTVEQLAYQIGVEYNVSERTVRKWFSEKLGLKQKLDVEPEQYVKAQKRKFDKTKKRFIITWGQNNTRVHKGFYENIEAYAKEIDADIHIILGRYKNPTSIWTAGQKNEETWSDEIIKYGDANRHSIHKYVSIMSDVKIQPTAINPMSGMQGMSGINSCIFGSPKVQLEMIPVLESAKPKMMLSTGSVTVKNYTDSKSGKQGEFHHTLGFVIVEIKDKDVFFVRQVTADDKTGSFSDLYYRAEGGKVSRVKSIEAIVLGDVHFGHHDQKVIDTTLSFMDKVKPNHVILHDVFDGDSISHHQMKDPFIQYGKEMNGTNDLNKELDVLMKSLKPFEKHKNVVIVRSNHDDFLDRWLKNEDWKKQPTFKNSRLYMQLSDILLEQYGKTPMNVEGVIPALIKQKYPKFITLGRSASYKVKGGWELGQHGDLGTSGSRGSIQQFRRLNTKIIVGHYHKPERKDGALSVGTSTHLRVGYNQGPSPWLQSHVIIHEDGKAQHISFINGEFTTFK